MRRSLNFKIAATAAVVITLGWATMAQAADTFWMFGLWHQQRGTVGIPLIDPAPFLTEGTRNGDIPAAADAQVSQTGAGPARTINMGDDKFVRIPPFAYHLGLPTNATVVQVLTELTMTGPAGAPHVGNSNVLKGGPKASRPVNFSGCAATGFPLTKLSMCTNVNGGAWNGRVVYTAGTTQFGGVMQMLIKGSGVVTNVIVASPLGPTPTASQAGCPNMGNPMDKCPVVVNRPFGGGGNAQAQGGPFGTVMSDMLLASEKFQLQGTGDCTQMVGIYDVKGCVLSWDPTPLGLAGASTNKNLGFPWTTGTVMVRATKGPTPLSPNTTYTSTGFDDRTAGGAGNIGLVTGAVTLRNAGSTYASMDTIDMALYSTAISAQTPSMAPVGIAAFMGLMALAGGYRLRRKQNRH